MDERTDRGFQGSRVGCTTTHNLSVDSARRGFALGFVGQGRARLPTSRETHPRVTAQQELRPPHSQGIPTFLTKPSLRSFQEHHGAEQRTTVWRGTHLKPSAEWTVGNVTIKPEKKRSKVPAPFAFCLAQSRLRDLVLCRD